MAKGNRTYSLDLEVIEFIDKQGNRSDYLNELVRAKMVEFPVVAEISFATYHFKCHICHSYIKSDEKETECPYCLKRRVHTNLGPNEVV